MKVPLKKKFFQLLTSLFLIFLVHSSIVVFASSYGKDYFGNKSWFKSTKESKIIFSSPGPEIPALTYKSVEIIDNNEIYNFSISFLDDGVLKALEVIKTRHAPGASIAFEFSPVEIDKINNTVKVGVAKGKLNQQTLTDYLQKQLNNLLGKEQ